MTGIKPLLMVAVAPPARPWALIVNTSGGSMPEQPGVELRAPVVGGEVSGFVNQAVGGHGGYLHAWPIVQQPVAQFWQQPVAKVAGRSAVRLDHVVRQAGESRARLGAA
ncbi:hypothetical protein [Streptomyces sp. 6N223]|uniref:hypothetical protein n=1 Tax=Streptomyces sp. 6N223 TaxID=3457412 RepID=UPI003FD64AD0